MTRQSYAGKLYASGPFAQLSKAHSYPLTLDFRKRARTTRLIEAEEQALELDDAAQWEEAIAVAEEADELEQALRLIEEQAWMEPPVNNQAESSTGRKRRALPTPASENGA